VASQRQLAALWLLAVVAWASGCSVYDASLVPPTKGIGDPTETDAAPNNPAKDAAPADLTCQAGLEHPTCTRAHADATCVESKCLIADCQAPYVDCDQDDANGCETTLTAVEHCGLCGAACRYSHAAGSCNEGRCSLAACDQGFANCDGDENNGCETAVDSISDCGECQRACAVPSHAVAGCIDSACAIASCVGAFGDCNGDAQDGCEQMLTSAEHCGACQTSCAPPHTETSTCASGKCVVTTCTSPFRDCNGLAADGCEAAPDSPDHCGACGAKCSLPHVTRTTCDVSAGTPKCGIDHGCPAGAEGCTPGAPTNGCATGFSDCDQNAANGCETDLSRTSDCGACKQSCKLDHTQRECKAGSCSTEGCAPGYGRCAGTCQSLLNDPNNCGQCGMRCGADKPNCAGGKCTTSTCASGSADCDANAANACEANLDDAANCGGCGLRCERLAHAVGTCRAGVCELGNCDAGFGDCDQDANNGCEIDLRSVNDCGRCGALCAFPNALAECRDGRCQLQTCDDKRADCNRNAMDGCEADLGLPSTCGSCANLCAQLPSVVSSSCGSEGCELTCQAGRANCDGRPDNGCEADLSNGQTCGTCNNDCGQLPRVDSAECDAGVCKKLKCEAGFADCNGDPADGCERSIRTLTDCGGCNQACAPAHATGACSTGECQPANCDSGFGNCDGNPQNGCEAALSTPEHCGSCATACSGTDAKCQNGVCGCASDADCPATDACCDGQCTSKQGVCYVWPCIPGTNVGQDRLNCGGCGQVCALWCCGPLLPLPP
jgi:hypothetical protein